MIDELTKYEQLLNGSASPRHEGIKWLGNSKNKEYTEQSIFNASEGLALFW